MSYTSLSIIIPNFQNSFPDEHLLSPDDLILLSSTHLSFRGKSYRCATGKGGIREDKIEGDGATPVGTFALREILYRADRFNAKEIELITNTGLPVSCISSSEGWCDDSDSTHYNKRIPLPSPDRHECLWREESVYDIIIPLGYNNSPIVPGKGSAIFMHLARPDYTPTEGCIALSREDFLEVLKKLR